VAASWIHKTTRWSWSTCGWTTPSPVTIEMGNPLCDRVNSLTTVLLCIRGLRNEIHTSESFEVYGHILWCMSVSKTHSTVWVQKSPPLKISYIFPEQLGICNPNFNILHTYYTFLSTLDYYLLLHYLKLWRSDAILSATTQRAFGRWWTFWAFYFMMWTGWSRIITSSKLQVR